MRGWHLRSDCEGAVWNTTEVESGSEADLMFIVEVDTMRHNGDARNADVTEGAD